MKYSDNIIVMKNGKIIDYGKANEVINIKLLNEVYNIGGFIQEHQGEKLSSFCCL